MSEQRTEHKNASSSTKVPAGTTECPKCGGLGAIISPLQWSESGKACWSVAFSCSCPAGQTRDAHNRATLDAVDWSKGITGDMISIPIDFGREDEK